MWRSLIPLSLLGLALCMGVAAPHLRKAAMGWGADLVVAACGLVIILQLVTKGAAHLLRAWIGLLLWVVTGRTPRCPGCGGGGGETASPFIGVPDLLLVAVVLFLVALAAVFVRAG